MKMISKDRLIDTLLEMKQLTADKYEAIPKYIDWFIRIVNGEEEVDAEPVRNGHWKTYDDEPGDFCSLCGKETHDMHDEVVEFNGTKVIALCLPRYCGYCGARMDGEDDEWT